MPSSRPSGLQGSRRSHRAANASSAATNRKNVALLEHRHQQGEDDLRQQREVPVGERQAASVRPRRSRCSARRRARADRAPARGPARPRLREARGGAVMAGSARASTSMVTPIGTRRPIPDCLVLTSAASTSARGASDLRPGDAAREIAEELGRQPDGEQRGDRKRRLAVRRMKKRGTKPGLSGPTSSSPTAQAHQGGVPSAVPASARASSRAAAQSRATLNRPMAPSAKPPDASEAR